jgi:hypothetical protein
MQIKNIEDMSFSEIKNELIQTRRSNEQVVSDLKLIIEFAHRIMQKYQPEQRNFLNDLFPEPKEMTTKNNRILLLLKHKGPMTSEEIIIRLINDKVFDDSEISKRNIRSRLSILVNKGIIAQDGRGKPFKLIKELFL